MPTITGAKSLDLIGGPLVQFDYAAWVADGAASTFLNGGFLGDDFEVEDIIERGKIEAGNCTWPIASYPIKTGMMIRGTLLEASLRKLEAMRGGLPATVNVITKVATLPIKEVTTVNYWTLKITVANLSLKPEHTEFATDVYTSRVYTIWRCTFKTRGGIKLDKSGFYKIGFEAEVFYDTSITEAATKGALGKIVDTMP